ncbi:MAG: hypothetical protein KDB84_10035, partial [Flavobacteriales bacterium]|nr:hypothetical protein [Flavobacteriales bacterium]
PICRAIDPAINDGGINCSAGGQGSGDVWYQFTATASSAQITVAPGAILDAVWQLYDTGSSCGSLAPVICTDGPGAGGAETDVITGFTVGETYLLRVMDYALYTPGATTFNICVVSAPDCIASPTAPTNGDEACFTSATTTLTWPASPGATGYDVYFGTSPAPSLVASNQAGTTYNAATPSGGTYYWRVVPRNTHGARSDCNTVWSFVRNALPVISTGSYGPACSTDPAIDLNAATPVGGTWSGTGVSGDTFDPSAGTQLLTYAYTDGNGCSASGQTTVSVTTAPAATIAYAGSPYTVGSGTATVTLTGSTGGTFSGAPAGIVVNSGTGEVDLVNSSPGSYVVSYEIIDGPCTLNTSTNIELVAASTSYYSQGTGDVSDAIWATTPVGTPAVATFDATTDMVVQNGHVVTST